MSRHETGFRLSDCFQIPKGAIPALGSTPPAKGYVVGSDGREKPLRRARPKHKARGELAIKNP